MKRIISPLAMITMLSISCATNQGGNGLIPKLSTNSALQVADGYNYVSVGALSQILIPGHILSAPPADGTAEARLDYEYIALYQANRTVQDCDRARAEAKTTIATFFGPPYGPLTTEEVAQYSVVLDKVLADAKMVSEAEKLAWSRRRPPLAHQNIHPCVPVPASTSYPSGHSTEAHTLALALDAIDPLRTAEFERRADAIAKDRLLAGVHYPSDVEAGKLLARFLFQQIAKSPTFILDLREIQKRYHIGSEQ